MAEYPYYPVVPIDADHYRDMDHDYNNLTVYSFAICHKDLDEEIAYQITKAVLENNPEMVSAVAAARDTIPENMQYVNLVVHPGSYRYYKEIGIELPDEIIPDEVK